MEADDPTGGYMLQAGARICKSLGEEFLPYLSIVMPPLLKSAQLKPDVKVTDVDDDEDDDEDEDVSSQPLQNVLNIPSVLLIMWLLGCKINHIHAGGRDCMM